MSTPNLLCNPAERRIVRIALDRILTGAGQPRSSFDEASIANLAASIRRFGLLSPLLLRRRSADEYELIAGERRLRALKLLGCAEADAIVLRAYDRDCALIALIENLEREELHFLDEAEACRRILSEHGLTQEELAAVLSRSPSALANQLRLLRLDAAVRSLIRSSSLTERHARALLKLEDGSLQLHLAELAIQKKWSVRQLESHIEALLRQSQPRDEKLCIRDRRLVINAFQATLRQLQRLGVQASSRVESRADSYDIIFTIHSQS